METIYGLKVLQSFAKDHNFPPRCKIMMLSKYMIGFRFAQIINIDVWENLNNKTTDDFHRILIKYYLVIEILKLNQGKIFSFRFINLETIIIELMNEI